MRIAPKRTILYGFVRQGKKAMASFKQAVPLRTDLFSLQGGQRERATRKQIPTLPAIRDLGRGLSSLPTLVIGVLDQEGSASRSYSFTPADWSATSVKMVSLPP